MNSVLGYLDLRQPTNGLLDLDLDPKSGRWHGNMHYFLTLSTDHARSPSRNSLAMLENPQERLVKHHGEDL